MSAKLSREELKKLTAEEKIAYQQALNRERVAKYRAENKEKADKYNREYKKDYINRPENRDKYKELNIKYVKKHNNKMKEILSTFEILKANKTAQKLTAIEKEGKAAIEEGHAILRRIQQRMN